MHTTPEQPIIFRRRLVYATANQKGGVGKTTTSINLAYAMAMQGCKTLLVDLDPQSNATIGLGVRPATVEHNNVYHLLNKSKTVEDVIQPTPFPNLSLLPANMNLSQADSELMHQPFSQASLLSVIRDLPIKDVSFVVIDCPPSLGGLTINALIAASAVLIPVQCEYYALEGLTYLLKTIQHLKSRSNPSLRIAGILMSMFDKRNRLSHSVVNDVRARLSTLVFKTVIPRSVRIAESPGFGLPIGHYDPDSAGDRAYRQLAREIIKREQQSGW